MIITIYNNNTGKIRKTVSGSLDIITKCLANDESYIEGEYALNGQVVDGLFQTKKETYPEYPADTIIDAAKYLPDKAIFEKALINTGVPPADMDSVCRSHYEYLRICCYPKIEEYNDGYIKLNSGIPELETEGRNQLDAYIQACLDVKTKFPKE